MADATVEQMLKDYAAGKITFDQLKTNFASRTDWVTHKHATSLTDMYAQAEEMPGPNDTKQLDTAVNLRRITYEEYVQLYDAVAEATNASEKA